MPTTRRTTLAVALYFAFGLVSGSSFVSSSLASDELHPHRFARMRPGATAQGPMGLPQRVDRAVVPATFQAVAAKPLTPTGVDLAIDDAGQPDVVPHPPTLIAPRLVATDRSDAVDAESDAKSDAATPADSSRSNGRRLLAASEPRPLIDRGPKSNAGLGNPFASLTSWRPSTQSLTATVGAAAVAIGLVVASVWLLRCCVPKSARPLPREVVEILGRAPLSGKQTTQLVRVGPKLVLINVTPDGAETLTEITDPVEVARMIAACESERGSGSEAEFDTLLREMSLEQPASGFLDDRDDNAHADRHDTRNGPRGFADGAFDPRSLAAAYANTPGGRGDG